MKKFYREIKLGIKIWLLSGCLLGLVITIVCMTLENTTPWWILFPATLVSLLGCLPLVIFAVTAISLFKRSKASHPFTSSQTTQTYTMETAHPGYPAPDNSGSSQSNKILIKGLITGALILLMLIPTIFITSLVQEREGRQLQISKEVSSKWATAQTLSGPFLYLPYKTYTTDKEGKKEEELRTLWILPENLSVNGTVDPQVRQRSIYKVLLYRTLLQDSGNFEFQLPKDIDPANVQFTDARICLSISDFKGIEKRVAVQFNGVTYELSPGLPGEKENSNGLSSSVALTAADLGKKISFFTRLQLKGSEQLHFLPLAGNSEFTLQSDISNPSFDGNNLPADRHISNNGFSAKWIFNKANLPFGTVLKEYKLDEKAMAFGLTILEPADQYAKTERCVKYAILFIGLTFGLFFIIELMQHKPVHPVQYILIGLALVIFYTLLLSVSEFILFDWAYAIAAIATISLITAYAYSHFKKFSSAAIFAGVLCTLYGFIFILIRLEDTALLVGSIGLFIVLALVMFASRKINWYGEQVKPAVS